ncbi:MAG TPA: hypothetical protein DEA22_09695 [Blastocatellia bacterium]|nr:hypothetical protein [Blastocatellia bacterium]
MKGIIRKVLFGNDTKTSGLIALAVVSLIAFGCTCGKDFDFSKLGSDGDQGDNRPPDAANTSSNSTSTEPDNGFPFPGSTTDTDKGESLPDSDEMEALVKDTTADFALAVSIEDFTLIHAKASSDFQSSYTADEMKNAFKSFVTQKTRLLPSLYNVAIETPKFATAPHIRYENNIAVLVADGEFPTKPFAVKFEYEYVFRDGEWKMLKLVIKM